MFIFKALAHDAKCVFRKSKIVHASFTKVHENIQLSADQLTLSLIYIFFQPGKALTNNNIASLVHAYWLWHFFVEFLLYMFCPFSITVS
jgi:hypothetical protein